MQGRFRRGVSSVGTEKCDGCDRMMMYGEVYLAIDEKPSDKYKEETIYFDEIECSDCGSIIGEGEQYLLTIESDGERVYCHNCLKKKGGETFRKKNAGALLKFEKSRSESKVLRFCRDCCEKRRVGMERKEKGEKYFTFFASRTGK